MSNVTLSDTTTLNNLFAIVDEWGNLPSNCLSEQQIALMNLKNTVLKNSVDMKNGGALANLSNLHQCFICVTGV